MFDGDFGGRGGTLVVFDINGDNYMVAYADSGDRKCYVANGRYTSGVLTVTFDGFPAVATYAFEANGFVAANHDWGGGHERPGEFWALSK